MPDQYVFELLRTMALQILQSAGFDSAHTDPTHVLTDIMGKYIEMLAATASAYAQLAGRANPNPFDVMDSLHEVDIDLDTLREWLDEEGKALMPAWTAQSDPGRTIEGFVGNGRRRYDDALVFEYRDMEENSDNEEEAEEAEEAEEEAAESADTEETEHPLSPPDQIPDTLYTEKQQEEKNLPSHIPPYMPPFPSDTKEEDQPPPQLPHLQQQQQQQQQQHQHPLHPALAHNSDAPAPIIVRHRRKPVDNPFTHVVSYEESIMATEKTTPALTLPSPSSVEENQDKAQSRQHQEDVRPNRNLPMKRALESLQSEPEQSKKARLGLSGNHTMFRQFTQDEAAPGNTMFTSNPGILGELLRRVAPPAMVSKLSSPNLLVDVAATQQYNAPNGAPANAVNTAEKTPSMLATLAGGQYNKKPEEPTPSSAAQPTSALPASNENNTTVSKQPSAPISLASLSAGAASSSSSSSSKKKKLPKLMLNLSNGEAAAGGPASSSSADNTPVSTPSTAAPKIRFKIKPPEPAAAATTAQSGAHPEPASSSTTFSSAAPQPTSSAAASTPTTATSLPASTSIAATMPSATTATTTTTTTTTTTSAATPAVITPAALPIDANSTEIIRCVCDHPTVDYGAFMIACDQCGVWFHGNCVGIAESDQVEEWYCSSCRPASS
ncbi:hypothetical protein BCR43DRAFT_526981 [Syncephalastrum racemosum]|uniref:PHD-type domain-containing protein n=1 Tax=Syncephalastrum racemosum TaxID=13706 RepID=A0A1X2H4T5_SYNRA|nr:hypothetical protein BCR43DRAFT_526981 [Syncephalastrum racemosum]